MDNIIIWQFATDQTLIDTLSLQPYSENAQRTNRYEWNKKCSGLNKVVAFLYIELSTGDHIKRIYLSLKGKKGRKGGKVMGEKEGQKEGKEKKSEKRNLHLVYKTLENIRNDR